MPASLVPGIMQSRNALKPDLILKINFIPGEGGRELAFNCRIIHMCMGAATPLLQRERAIFSNTSSAVLWYILSLVFLPLLLN